MEPLYYKNHVRADFPFPAMDHREERIDLNKEFILHPNSTFLVASVGDSMMDAYIPPKAILVVDRSLPAQNGDIVVVMLNGKSVVRFLQKNNHFCRLVPANKKYPDIKFIPEMDMHIWGVVTHIITNSKDIPSWTRW